MSRELKLDDALEHIIGDSTSGPRNSELFSQVHTPLVVMCCSHDQMSQNSFLFLFPYNEVLCVTSKVQPSCPEDETDLASLSLITIAGGEMSITRFKSNSATEAETFKSGKLSQKSPS